MTNQEYNYTRKFFLFQCLMFNHFRYGCFEKLLGDIDQHEGGIEKFSEGYKHFGMVATSSGVFCHEWIPDVQNVFLYGDFSK